MPIFYYALSGLYAASGVLLTLFLILGGCLNVCPELIIWVYEIGIVALLFASAVAASACARKAARIPWYLLLLALAPLLMLAIYVLRATVFFWW